MLLGRLLDAKITLLTALLKPMVLKSIIQTIKTKWRGLVIMFTRNDLIDALKSGDRSKRNFLTIVDEPLIGYKIKLIPKHETKYSPDGLEGPVVVCFSSFNENESFIGVDGEFDSETVNELYQRLIYMYLSFRISGKRCFDEDLYPEIIKDLQNNIKTLNDEVEKGISCLRKELNL